MAPLPDGHYDAVISSVTQENDGNLVLELTVTSGDHQGQSLVARSSHQRFGKEPSELEGLPVDVTLRYGVPDVTLAG